MDTVKQNKKKITQNFESIFYVPLLMALYSNVLCCLQRTEPGPGSKRIMTLLSKMEMSQAHRDVSVDFSEDSQYNYSALCAVCKSLLYLDCTVKKKRKKSVSNHMLELYASNEGHHSLCLLYWQENNFKAHKIVKATSMA